MNLRERRWLANIQVMQLEGDDPDYDFYFTGMISLLLNETSEL
jgi:hypothetical protein